MNIIYELGTVYNLMCIPLYLGARQYLMVGFSILLFLACIVKMPNCEEQIRLIEEANGSRNKQEGEHGS